MAESYHLEDNLGRHYFITKEGDRYKCLIGDISNLEEVIVKRSVLTAKQGSLFLEILYDNELGIIHIPGDGEPIFNHQYKTWKLIKSEPL